MDREQPLTSPIPLSELPSAAGLERGGADKTAPTPATSGQSMPATVAVEQAVFTSVPSPMGRGYRLVAASPGLTGDERREITQRAPSHGNLLDPSENASGLASFEIRGGRRCLFCSWHAEAEHSGRGGRRVHTQVVILEPAVWERFAFNPLVIEELVQSAVDRMAIPKPDSRLPLLELPLPANPCSTVGAAQLPPAGPETIDAIIAIVALLISEQRLLAIEAGDGRLAMRHLLELLPPALRKKLSFTCGMRFAPTRALDLVLTEGRREEIDRIVRDQNYEAFAWNQPPEISLCDELSTWYGYIRKIWRIEGFASVRRQYDRLGGEATIESLRTIGRLMLDIERVPQANIEQLERILEPHLPFVRKNDLQMALHLRLVQIADARRRSLSSLLPDVALTLP